MVYFESRETFCESKTQSGSLKLLLGLFFVEIDPYEIMLDFSIFEPKWYIMRVARPFETQKHSLAALNYLEPIFC